MMRPHVVVDLIDADGCIYNKNYHSLLIWLIKKYRDKLQVLQQARVQEQESGIKNDEVEIAVREIKQDIDACDISSFNVNRAMNELGWNADKIVDCMIKPQELGFGARFRLRESSYIDMLNMIDISIMQSILLKANVPLMQHLTHHSEPHVLQEIGIGSARQTDKDDLAGAKYNGSGRIFHDLFYLASVLRAETKAQDKHLAVKSLTLPDIGSSLPRGENYRRIMTNYQGVHETYGGDLSKLSQLYAMIHDTASHYSAADHTVHFYDNDVWIIAGLVRTFSRYPELLPAQTTLVIHRYDGRFGSEAVIKGTGSIDFNYRHNVREMLSLARHHAKKTAIKPVHVVRHLDIPLFLASRECRIETNPVVASNKTFTAMHATQNMQSQVEFQSLSGNVGLFHLKHRDCVRLFSLAAPEKQRSDSACETVKTPQTFN